MLKKEFMPYWNLSVTVQRGKFNRSYDLLSKCDCYVVLKLPSACACCHRTKTVKNSNAPNWNETFHFRVHSGVKNILEFHIFDADTLTKDDYFSTILFDINNLTPGQKQTKCFITDDKKKSELWVEFEATVSSEKPEPYFSNGVLMAGPFCALDVKVEKRLRSNVEKDMMLKLRGAYKEDCLIPSSEENPSCTQTIRYYINRDLETEFSLIPPKAGEEVDGINPKIADILSSVPMKPLPDKQQIKLTMPIGKDEVDLQLSTEGRSDEKLDVRLDFDISMEENNFLVKRRKVVSQALQKALNLSSAPEPSKVPLVAVVCSGGGTRAMTGTFGGLRALQKLQLLDTVSYITGISGSTWTMASLYGDANWSNNDLNVVLESVKKEISKSVFSIFSIEQLRHYKKKMEEREKEGHQVSLVDMWGLAIEYLIQGKKEMGTLSDQQMALSKGQNPFPIYTALNMKNGKTGCTIETEWCEFTPYEVGFTKYGAFIPAQNFGSEYYLGHMIKKLPESGIYSLLGIWSSVFSLSLTQLWSAVTGVIPSWASKVGEEVNQTDKDDKPSTSDTLQVSPMTNLAKKLSNFLTSRPIISQVFNFLRGFHLHRNYSENCDFTTWKDTHPDAFPNSLTPADATLGLVDTAFVLKSGFPPVLRSNRRADVILSLNYAWDPDHFKVIKQTQEYCTDRKIPFPKIDYKTLESEPIREIYVFEDKENPDAPIVIHFPLVNISFKQFKSPGVKREGKAEMKEGDFDIDFTSMFCPFATHNLTYHPEDFQKLSNLTTYNILNNKDVILSTLNKALKRNMERIPATKASKF
ncbi:cytosolic phospholipase A2 zeta-like [Sinocyclocheilus rhinocerous]|uniref:cytosolic phospholipase A2 zeta-like n=1 Tax=Sinocyclocheilus rhinocerous TaxID=307959 RepID=UPI0007BAD71C|nr:PREDICTED: cytosolic phospholipase A2 zeta-like [Sinocyclocheilus rhinocerous]